VLAFLPGAGEIPPRNERSTAWMRRCAVVRRTPFAEQERALRPSSTGRRKVILSTSVAETSLTIDGIEAVVDSGWSRRSRFDP
jgi:ATP-dependent helicase HrpB